MQMFLRNMFCLNLKMIDKPPCLEINHYVQMAIEEIKILGAVLYLPARQHCQSSPIYLKHGLNGPNWWCCLAGSSKTVPRILIFSIVMCAKYSF